MNVPLLNQPNQSSNDVFYSGELYLQFESLRLNAPSKPSWLSNFTLYVLVHHYTRTLAGVKFFFVHWEVQLIHDILPLLFPLKR